MDRNLVDRKLSRVRAGFRCEIAGMARGNGGRSLAGSVATLHSSVMTQPLPSKRAAPTGIPFGRHSSAEVKPIKAGDAAHGAAGNNAAGSTVGGIASLLAVERNHLS